MRKSTSWITALLVLVAAGCEGHRRDATRTTQAALTNGDVEATVASALFTRGPRGLELQAVIERGERWTDRAPLLVLPNACWRLEDPAGELLACGDARLPAACDGVAYFRLDLPRHLPLERLVVTDLAGAPIGVYSFAAD